MDILKQEIERKRKEALDAAPSGRSKYLKRGEVEKLNNSNFNFNSKKQLELEQLQKDNSTRTSTAANQSSAAAIVPSADALAAEDSAPRIPEADLCARFRARGVPIRLFAEEYHQRVQRLKDLESTEERYSDSRLAQDLLEKQADGLENKEEVKKRELEAELEKVDTRAIGLKLLDKDPEKTRYLIGIYFKKLLLIWERTLNERDDAEKRSTQGRLALATRAQSAEYMKPFFIQLKRGTIESDVLARVTEICMHMQDREYLKANDAYLRLSIGNAPWPIGVTMVGIHERSGREKISSSQIAHGLNDETQRKWIQSIKRMMTFAQSKYPPDDLGKSIG
ncbi:Prp18-domain-containing protein [Rhizoclosmatium globosum]|uniref:Pre-mRNA-splicing factor 18 n=1 Tax=Rhizoclosmatium globosum TaxID=329046 RepID=A0A1Y2C8Z9_9FUNG|nr:Prp18-domain-containing protein [Rhizoclosmatium globosum]|eukprot:ORY43416.1 Prp18-domain-containing protein [Rhizoclosmatium globosum]